MTTLTLVRHGQASFGGANYDHLSELGHRQSRILGEHWRKLGIGFDACYSGELMRQRDTAMRLLEGLGQPPEFVIDPAFDEYDFISIMRAYMPVVAREAGELQIDAARVYTEPKLFQAVFERCIDCWFAGREHEHDPFETWGAFCERVIAGLRKVATQDREHVVVVTSGGVIAVALREALGLADNVAFQLNWRINNASVHSFALGRRGFSLLGYNNVAHLELAGESELLTFR
ncbi:MAG TPA: histidine phosphatase family protein [Solimonas sp.]|nr:histidine phosphatase family protein [Solimonas sp.]